VIDKKGITPARWVEVATEGLRVEKEELINQLLLGELNTIYWVYLSPERRQQVSIRLAPTLWSLMQASTQPNVQKQFFKAWTGLALSDSGKQALYTIWKDKTPPAGVKLTEDDYTDLAATLALNVHPAAADILKEQGTRIQNADKQARWAFLQASLSADTAVRDTFFVSLKDVKNRRKESWVVTAVGYLHHPLREKTAEKYLLPSLELLEELQKTGDIFFPQNWLGATLGQHQSAASAQLVQRFIDQHPGYNARLMNKLLQAADPLFRARKILQ
jgi:aminopeptidase N